MSLMHQHVYSANFIHISVNINVDPSINYMKHEIKGQNCSKTPSLIICVLWVCFCRTETGCTRTKLSRNLVFSKVQNCSIDMTSALCWTFRSFILLSEWHLESQEWETSQSPSLLWAISSTLPCQGDHWTNMTLISGEETFQFHHLKGDLHFEKDFLLKNFLHFARHRIELNIAHSNDWFCKKNKW